MAYKYICFCALYINKICLGISEKLGEFRAVAACENQTEVISKAKPEKWKTAKKKLI